MHKKTQNRSLPARFVGWMAKAVGYQLTPQQEQALDRRFRSFGLTLFVWGTWNQKRYIKDGYGGNSTVYSIISRITKMAAIAPFRVYRVKDIKKALRYKHWTGQNSTPESRIKAMLIKEQAFEEDTEHPFNALLKKPNKRQGWNEFCQTSIGFRLITGNRFLWDVRLDKGANEGKLVAIYNLPPQHMNILASNMFTVVGYQMICGEVVPYSTDEITHSKYWNPDYDMTGSHLWGMSPLQAGSKDLDRSNKASQRGVTILENAGAAGVVFEKSGKWSDLTDEQTGLLRKKFNEEMIGQDNAGKIAIANGDVGYHNFAMTAVEMGVIDMEKYSDEKIANLYAFPAGLLTANANATDNNIRAWNKQLLTNCCIPELAALRDDLNAIAEKDYPGEQIFVDFDTSVYPELQEDLGETAKVMAQAWWIKGNEKRLAMGYDEDTDEPMMNTYLVSSSVQPINDIDPERLQNELDSADQATNREADT